MSEHKRSVVTRDDDSTIYSHVSQGHEMDLENPIILYHEENSIKRKLAESFFMEFSPIIEGNEMSLKPYLTIK